MAKKQKSGLYRTKIKIGVDANGNDILKYISAKTKRELEQRRQEVVAYYIDGTGLEGDVLFGEYATKWFTNIKKPELSPSSLASYRSMLNKHVFPAFGTRNLRAIKAFDLQIWLNGFAGESKTTIALALTIIRNIFASATADRILSINPAAALKAPKAGKVETRRSLTDEESHKVEQIIAQHPHGDYMACLYYLGVRAGEARGLMWGDFDWQNNIVHIQRDIDFKASAQAGELKTEAAYRDIPIPEELRAKLWPLRGHPNAYLFVGQQSGKPWSKATAERIWLDMMKSVDLVKDRDGQNWKNPDIRCRLTATITPHYLRHNYITKCWEAGIDPMITMRIVGHADYRTTANIYTHLTQDHLARSREDLNNAFAARKVAQFQIICP